MEGLLDYDAAASTIKIEDITTDEINREILRKLKGNDPTFEKLRVYEERSSHLDNRYCPQGARDFGWLGYYIGQNTYLRKLILRSNIFRGVNSSAIESFFRGVNSNRSIQKIRFNEMDLSGGELFQSLRPFFEENDNLTELQVDECEFGAGCARQLSLLLRGCNKSLKSVNINRSDRRDMEGEQFAEIMEALSVHPQLETLILWRMNIRTNEHTALVNLLHGTFELQTLNLYHNDIDDEGIETLAGALLPNSNLRNLFLHRNRIMARGCQSLAALLENPNTNLEELHLNNNNFGNEGAHILANALTTNRKLKTLDLGNNGITVEGYSSFSKVFCDASSANKTFLSNHTVESLGFHLPNTIPADVNSLLVLNRSSDDKRLIAMKKILQCHQHFDMHPFFEWDLKVLPHAVSWFERARFVDNDEAGIDRHKLGAIYQFMHAMPEVFEPVPGACERGVRWND